MPDSPRSHVLKTVFGYDSFRPGQEPVIAALEGGGNVLAVMPTGAGKSLCYQIPALVRGGLTLVVSPLVALMHDQVAALRLNGVAAETINSSRPRPDNVAVWRRVAAGAVRLLYLSPERLMEPRMLAALGRLPVSLIAVDEAHCISQWGASFRPEYEALSGLRTALPGVPIAAFTATADEATRTDILAKLFGGEAELFVHGFDRPNLSLTVAPRTDLKRQLLRILAARPGDSGIVYCLSRRKSEDTAAMLRAEGIRALAYHAGMDAAARDAAQRTFMTEPGVVMVATVAFGMGIDKPDVRFVIHADLPGSLEAYYQEIGRAGRDGLPADAHLLFALGDIRTRRMFIEDEHRDEARRRRELHKLDAMVAFCEASACRRAVLLRYFGEDPEPCGNCDLCRAPASLVEATEAARAVLDLVRATGERFGAAHVCDLAHGSATAKAVAAGHDRLAGFGALKAMPRPALRSLVRQLVSGGLLELDIAGHGGLSLSVSGQALLAGTGAFHCRLDPLVPAARRRASAAPAPVEAADAALLSRLKTLRSDLARARGVPAYVIFPDRTLIDMAARRPATPEAFAEVHGVGAAKLREFARPFLDAINAA